MTNKLVAEIRDIDYHAARLLILIAYCGSPATEPSIKGRTLLAKLDFFLRYPAYLEKAALIQKNQQLVHLMEYELNNVETRMIRYKYGPWDNVYYSVLAYLIGKDLISVDIKNKVEYFRLTPEGNDVVQALTQSSAYRTVVARAKVLKKLFPSWSGASVKRFIYDNFPEVVSLPLGKEISL